MVATEKTCTLCRQVLTAQAFAPDVRLKSGLCSRCRKCQAQVARERRAANPQASLAAVRKWEQKHPEKVKEWARAGYHRYAAQRKEKVGAYQAQHPNEVKGWKTKYARSEKGLERKRQKEGKRRALKQASGAETVPAWVVAKLFDLFEQHCVWCTTRKATQLDHIIPLSKGGPHIATNLAPSCATCNLSKSAKDPHTWAQKCGVNFEGLQRLLQQNLGQPN